MKNIIVNALKDDYDLFYADLMKLIQIESVSNNKEKVIHALKYVIDKALEFGLDAKCVLDNQIGLIEYGNGQNICGILCHVDVVDVNKEDWFSDPFELITKDNKLFGRGIIDGKGPLLLILYILKYFKKYNIKTKDKIQLIIGTQEEVVWNDIKEYKKHFILPDYGFTPDGYFPIQNAEKGLLDLAFKFNKDNIKKISAGNATNTVADSFNIEIDNCYYSFTGTSAHSSTPELGDNAIVKGIKQLNKSHSHFLIDFISDYLSDITGLKFNLRQDDIIDDIDNKTTIVPTMIEETQTELFLSVNIRLAHTNTYDKIINKLLEIKDDYQFDFEQFDYIKPIYVDPSSEFVQILTKAYEEETNNKVKYIFANNTSYAKALPNFVCFGPSFTVDDSAHQANENFKIEDMFNFFRIYVNALLKAKL